MTADGERAIERRTRIAEAITAHRRAGSQSPVLVAVAADDPPYVEYCDREIVVRVDDAQRDRLDALLAEFPVFKIAQPATRKAPDGEVHVSAIADPKHAADFLDTLFLDVFDRPDDYDLRIEG
ncbi:hypothetical protein SAMN05216388_1001251 [Halorientalis persicus]|uniref:DUF7975 domain-containing protein n=1 Tax=Halorientalis persicus TaxID=1367881 RepID=A0A1H8DCR8_9EURY|nr:hypothetical protein [Halorientalis persicus]SEN05161.1 hypothetical protein SAMN05216388_1001251 [Halorientalis persicus]